MKKNAMTYDALKRKFVSVAALRERDRRREQAFGRVSFIQ